MIINLSKKTKDYVLYTLQDLFANEDEPNNNVIPELYYYLDVMSSRLGWELSQTETAVINDEIVRKLFYDYILPKNLKENIVCTSITTPIKVNDNSIEAQDLRDKVYGEWLRLFINKIVTTYPRYKTLITLYQNSENELLNKIETESISIFNDTPQDIVQPIGNQYASNVTKNKTSTDALPLIERLEAIRSKWDNIYKEWCEEFNSLFMEDIDYD